MRVVVVGVAVVVVVVVTVVVVVVGVAVVVRVVVGVGVLVCGFSQVAYAGFSACASPRSDAMYTVDIVAGASNVCVPV